MPESNNGNNKLFIYCIPRQVTLSKTIKFKTIKNPPKKIKKNLE